MDAENEGRPGVGAVDERDLPERVPPVERRAHEPAEERPPRLVGRRTERDSLGMMGQVEGGIVLPRRQTDLKAWLDDPGAKARDGGKLDQQPDRAAFRQRSSKLEAAADDHRAPLVLHVEPRCVLAPQPLGKASHRGHLDLCESIG
jgi:hypothetical protein